MLNRCEFIGHLGRDPETRYTQGGQPVTSFSVAATEKWKDKQGTPQERTEWVNCTAFGRLAEVCGEYLRKGALVFVAGKMSTDKWEKDGVTRYSTKVILAEMKMLGRSERQEAATETAPAAEPNFDDDIPF